MEETDRTLIETEQRAKSNSHRLDEVEENQKEQSNELRTLTTTVNALAQSIEQFVSSQQLEAEHVRQSLEAHGKRLGALECQPAENWKLVVRTVLTGVVSALAGGLGALLLTQIH